MPRRPLLGPRLRLRPMDADDRALYRALYTDADVMAAIAPPLTAEQAERVFSRMLAHDTRDRPGHRHWIVETHAGERLGIAALLRDGPRAELGVMLLPSAWKRRVSTEAFELLLPHAFGPLGLELVDAQRPDDAHARVIDRLLTPFGFVRGAPTRPGGARWLLPRPVFIQRNLRPVGIQPRDR
ncbi:GNAT family N-acetyltransferase [Lysobacter humi (ex Lee et al. 2017)]